MNPIIPPYDLNTAGSNPSCHYSAHFTKPEMVVSDYAARRGIDNSPPQYIEGNLARLCIFYMEPIRANFGPLRITSGFRCQELNTAIGGSTTSAHMDGRAADFHPLHQGVTLKQVVDFIVASELDFDQVIFEFGQWVHIGIAQVGHRPRREALMIFTGTGYLPYLPNSPLVSP